MLPSRLPVTLLSGIFAAAPTAGIVLFTRSMFVRLSMHYAAIVAIGTPGKYQQHKNDATFIIHAKSFVFLLFVWMQRCDTRARKQ